MKKITTVFSFAIFLCLFSKVSFGQANFTADSYSGCDNINVQFTDHSTGATSWSWDLGNGNNASTPNPSALYNAPGTYIVTLTINGGTSSFTDTIHVYQSPVASLTADNDTTCIGGRIHFTSTSTQGTGAIDTYVWTFGDGTQPVTTTTDTTSHVFGQSGTFSTNLVITDIYGCVSASNYITIVVIQAPVPSFTMNPSSSCNVPEIVSFSNTTQPAAGSYIWTFGDPASGSADTSYLANPPSHTYNTAGSYTVTLTAISGTCQPSIQQVFTNSTVSAAFNLLPDTICVFDTIFVNSTSNPPPANFNWNFGDPASLNFNTSTLPTPSHIYGSSGWFYVTFIAGIGTCTDTHIDSVYVRPQPVFTAFTTDDSTRCNVPANIHFQSTGDANINQWHWDFGVAGNADSSIQQNPNYNYTGFGTYTIQLIATNAFGCSDTVTRPNYIQIIAPTVNILTSPDSGCANSDVFTFNATSTNVSGDTTSVYHWDFGDGVTVNNGPSVTHTYTQCNTYNVSVTITTSGGCTATDAEPNLIRTGFPPAADFTWQPSVMCYNDSTFFTDASTANGCPVTGWSWDFGSNEQNPIHVFPDTGVFDVQLVAYSNGCPDTMKKTQIITIHPPKAIFTFYYNCADPYNVQFYDTSHGDELVVWSFGDGNVDASNAQSIIHTYANRGQYQVMLHAYNLTYGCDDSTTTTINIYDPVAIINVPNATGCHPYTANFNGSSSIDALSYAWDFGDPGSGAFNTSTLTNPSHTFNTTGFFTVHLTITDPHGCTADTTYQIHVTGPEASFTSPDTSGCRPFNAVFNSTSTTEGSAIVQYIWNFSYPGTLDLDTTTSGTANFTYQNASPYSVSLTTIDAAGCRDSIVNNFFIFVTFPYPTWTPDTFVCDSLPVTYTVNANDIGGEPFTFDWDFGDGSQHQINSGVMTQTDGVTHTYLQNNTHPVLSVTITDVNGCDTTISQAITVLRPSADFIPSQFDTCDYTLPNLHGPDGEYQTAWQWSLTGPNYTAGSLLQDPYFSFTHPGAYFATLTATNPGCSVTHTGDAIIVPGPEGEFSYVAQPHCPPLTVPFTASITNNDDSWQFIVWDFADGTIDTTFKPDTSISHTYYEDGNYTPIVQIGYALPSGSICTDTLTNLTGTNIVVQNFFDVDITQDTILLFEGGTDTLTSLLSTNVNDPPYTYTWTLYPDGEVLPNFQTTGAIYNSDAGDTAIVLVVTDNAGCESRDIVYIIVKLCEQDVKIPNVFTPGEDNSSGDGKNDTYYIKDLCPITDFRITIFNRWGNIVYESTDYNFHWDGTDDNGKDCSEGVYYYTLHAKRSNIHGYIHLIRGKGSK